MTITASGESTTPQGDRSVTAASWFGPNASFNRSLAAITAIAAVWRLGYLIFAKADEKLRINDALYYSIQASLNADGRWFEDGLTEQPGAEHGMLTSLYLTPWSVGSNDVVFRQRFALTILGVAAVAIVGLTGRRLTATLRPAATIEREHLNESAWSLQRLPRCIRTSGYTTR